MNMPSGQPKKLPANPSLEHLRKQARRLVRETPTLKLAVAQHRLAREYGFPSWADLKRSVSALRQSETEASIADVDAFLDAAVPRPDVFHKSGSLRDAKKLEHPQLAHQSMYAACVLGDEPALRDWLGKHPALVTQRGGPRQWTPLLYLCFSRYLRFRARKEPHFAACVNLLLAHGASVHDFFDNGEKETVLYGAAGVANSAMLTRILLAAGAEPDDDALYHVAEFSDHSALKLLIAARPGPGLSYYMCHKMDMEDPEGLELFIRHGADVNFLIGGGVFKGHRPLHFALFRRRSLRILRLLLDAGADPNLPAEDGTTPCELARLTGQKDAAELLVKYGAKDVTDPRKLYLSALSLGDFALHLHLLRENSGIRRAPDEKESHLLVDAAEAGNPDAVRLMLDEGFPLETRGTSWGGWNGTALHHAAWNGHVGIVTLLLDRGADPRLMHAYGGDALGAAIHGASHASHANGPAVVAEIAAKYRPEELDGYIAYADSEANSAVPGVLRRVQSEKTCKVAKPVAIPLLKGLVSP